MLKKEQLSQISTFEEAIEMLEELKQDKREKIGTTRTVMESHKLEGEVMGIDEALYVIKALNKSLNGNGISSK